MTVHVHVTVQSLYCHTVPHCHSAGNAQRLGPPGGPAQRQGPLKGMGLLVMGRMYQVDGELFVTSLHVTDLRMMRCHA